MNPKISIVIPTYNSEKFIENCIHSLLNQSIPCYEIIVINDGSTDNTKDILSKYKCLNVIHQTNKGPSSSRNLGIELAKGNWIAFLDSDDIWHKHQLKNMHEFIHNNEDVYWSFGAYNEKKWMFKLNYIYSRTDCVVEDFFAGCLNKMQLNTSSILINKKIFNNKSFRFNEEFSNSEDFELWMKIACLYPKIGYRSYVGCEYLHVNENSLTRIGTINLDDSMLSIKKRLHHDLIQLNAIQNKNAIKLLDHKIRNKLLLIWYMSNHRAECIKLYEEYYNENQIKLLNKCSSMPRSIKYLILKYIQFNET